VNDDDNQVSLFGSSLYEVSVQEPPHVEGTCSQCEHIIGMKFNNGNLYFCSLEKGNKKYGQHGKKIKKSNPACWHKKEADGEIPVFDGYYGGKRNGASR
jgi:hypothetical protein